MKKSSDDPSHAGRRAARRRTLIRTLLRLACVALGAGGAVLLVHLAYAFASGPGVDQDQWIQERIKNFLGGLGAFLAEAVIETLATRYPYRTMAFVGGFAALLPSKVAADWAYRRFFEQVLMPLRRPGASGVDGADPDATLPWVEPVGARRVCWDELNAWALEGLDADPAEVGWCVFVGRAGAGKSRTAHELARRLGRDDVFGPPTRPLRAKERASRALRAARFASAAYARNLLRRRRPDDPWDAGALHPGVRGGRWHVLAGWRPRRPTLLVLDDPQLTDSIEALRTLRTAAPAFRHPVRLLIVNQAVPSELGLWLEGTEWVSREEGGRAPIRFVDDARFTAEEVTWLARRVLGRNAASLARAAALRHFIRTTDGNPLLVELGLQWLARKRPLDDMSREGLLAERAGRVRVALEQAGVDPDAMRAIAAATLCGGGRRVVLEQQFRCLPSKRALAPAFPLDYGMLPDTVPPVRPELIGDEFVRQVAEESEGIANEIVKAAWLANPLGTLGAVLRLGSGSDAVARALRAGPPARWTGDRVELARAYAEQYARNGGDFAPVDRAIRALGPAEAAGALREFAEMLARSGVRGGPGLACFRRALEHALSEPKCLATPAEVARALHESARAIRWSSRRGFTSGWSHDGIVETIRALLARTETAVDGDVAGRGEVLAALAAFEDALEETGPDFQATVSRIVEMLAGLSFVDPLDRRRLQVAAHALRGKVAQALELAKAVEREAGTGEAASAAVGEAWRMVAYALVMAETASPTGEQVEGITRHLRERAGSAPSAADPLREARLLSYAAFGYMSAGGEEARAAAERIALRLDDLAGSGAGGVAFQRARLTAKVSLAWIYSIGAVPDAAGAERIAGEIDALVAPFAGEWKLELRRAEGWCAVVLAAANGGREIMHLGALARRVDQVCEPFEGDREFDHRRVTTWVQLVERHAAIPEGRGAARALAMAERIDEVAARFAGDPAFEFQRAVAWTQVMRAEFALGGRDALAEAEEIARRVDALSVHLAGDREFALLRVQAWHGLAQACYAVGEGRAAAEVEAIVRHLDSIGEAWATDRPIALERITAWERALQAHADVKTGGTGIPAVRIAQRIDALAAPFGGDPDFELQRVWAWSHVAHAAVERNVDSAWVEELARRVDAAALPFAGERRFDYLRAVTWRCACTAHTGDQIERAEELARRVDAQAAPFPLDPAFELEKAKVWAHIAYLWATSITQPGAPLDAAATEEAARHVERVTDRVEELATHLESLAAPFDGDRSFALQRAKGWRYAVIVNTHHRKSLSRAEQCVQRADALGEAFPDDHNINLERIQSWQHLTWGYATLLGMDEIARIQESAHHVDAIAAGFGRNPHFECERAVTWGYVACAQALAGLAQAEETAEHMDSISSSLPDIGQGYLFRPNTWRHVLEAYPDADAPAERAEALAARIDGMGRRGAGSAEFEIERVRAWTVVACLHAERSDPDLARAEDWAGHVTALAAPFSGHRYFEWVRVKMLRRIACASSAAGDEARALRLAGQMRAIVVRFPGDTAFEKEADALGACFGLLPAVAGAGDASSAAL